MKKKDFIVRKKSFITKIDNLEDVYILDDKILGRGRFGVVKKATHKMTKQVRVVKSILKSEINDLQKFKNEIENLRILDHPKVVKIYGWYEDEKNVFLVLEFCQGGELFESIANAVQFTEAQAKAIFKSIMIAVNYCHEMKIVHRDLKPENFVLGTKNDFNSLKLIDFGLSKVFEELDSGKTVRLKTRAGSSYYMAPEVRNGNYKVSCDIWSCGVILYILLCGFPPFGGNSENEIESNVMKMEYDFDEDEWKSVSQSAKDLIKKMITEASLRPSAKEILQDPWILSLSDPNSGKNLLPIIENISYFRTAVRLQKVVLAYMATHMTDQKINQLQKTFLQLDTDNDGKLSFEEFSSAFDSNCFKPEEIKEMMNSVDLDQDGYVEYTEFLASSIDENIYLQEDNLLDTFNNFDKNKSGKFSASELKEMLEFELHGCDEKILEEMIGSADLDNDHEIDFNEYMKLMYLYQKPRTRKIIE